MADPIIAQFGALDKLLRESAEAETKKQVALQRFQLGQMQSQMMAQQEIEQHQAEQEAGQQAAAQQPTPMFQLDLPTGSAMAERPVRWKNPLDQLAGNAYSQMAQAGGAGPGAAIQQALHQTAGAVPGAEQAMTQGLPVAGGNVTQSNVGMTLKRTPWGFAQQYTPEFSVNQQSTPNALTAQDQANLRAAILDRLLQEQGRVREGPKIDPDTFRQSMKDLNDQYGDRVPSQIKSQIAQAVATGDLETAGQLTAQLPSPIERLDPLERQAAMADFKDAQTTLDKVDLALDNKQTLRASLMDAQRVLEAATAQSGVIRGSKLGQLVQRLGATDETSVNVLQQAFSNQWVETVQSMRGLGALSDQEGKALSSTTGGLDKSVEFNLRDLRKRIAVLDSQIKRSQREREVAVSTVKGVRKRAGTAHLMPEPPAREEAVVEDKPIQAVQEATDDAGVDDLLEKYK
jgi:hypothetical protein